MSACTPSIPIASTSARSSIYAPEQSSFSAQSSGTSRTAETKRATSVALCGFGWLVLQRGPNRRCLLYAFGAIAQFGARASACGIRPTGRSRRCRLRLPKSVCFESEQLHAEHVSHRDQLAMAHTGAIGSDHYAHRIQAVGQLKHIPGLQAGELSERYGQVAQIEIQVHGNLIGGIGGIGI